MRSNKKAHSNENRNVSEFFKGIKTIFIQFLLVTREKRRFQNYNKIKIKLNMC